MQALDEWLSISFNNIERYKDMNEVKRSKALKWHCCSWKGWVLSALQISFLLSCVLILWEEVIILPYFALCEQTSTGEKIKVILLAVVSPFNAAPRVRCQVLHNTSALHLPPAFFCTLPGPVCVGVSRTGFRITTLACKGLLANVNLWALLINQEDEWSLPPPQKARGQMSHDII